MDVHSSGRVMKQARAKAPYCSVKEHDDDRARRTTDRLLAWELKAKPKPNNAGADTGVEQFQKDIEQENQDQQYPNALLQSPGTASSLLSKLLRQGRWGCPAEPVVWPSCPASMRHSCVCRRGPFSGLNQLMS